MPTLIQKLSSVYYYASMGYNPRMYISLVMDSSTQVNTCNIFQSNYMFMKATLDSGCKCSGGTNKRKT